MTVGARRRLEVSLPGHVVGHLEYNRNGHLVWRPNAEWEANGQHPRLGTAFLRDPGARSAGGRLLPFFENLLPEVGSDLRFRLAGSYGLAENDGAGLLAALGRDLAGAVEVRPVDVDGNAVAWTTPEHARDTPRIRFALAGMQFKVSMSQANDRFALPATGDGGDWIVKFPGRRYPELPRVEEATMKWARAAGFDVPECFAAPRDVVVDAAFGPEADSEEVFIVRRFDRRVDGSKIHQEDLCQVLNLWPTQKYGDQPGKRFSLDTVLQVVTDLAGQDQGRELARRLGFVIASGNDDAHLKNWSLQWGAADRPSLTPCYDFVSTITWANLHGWDSAAPPRLRLGLGDAQDFSQVSDSALETLVRKSRQAWARDEVLQGVEAALRAWTAVEGDVPEPMRAALRQHGQHVPLLRARGAFSGPA
jgi:serine/threonine-protein kinase HipA